MFQIGQNIYRTLKKLQEAYGEECMNHTQCYDWYQRFKSVRTSIEEDAKHRRPSSDNIHVEKI